MSSVVVTVSAGASEAQIQSALNGLPDGGKLVLAANQTVSISSGLVLDVSTRSENLRLLQRELLEVIAPAIEEFLKQEKRKVGRFVEEQQAVQVYFPKTEVGGMLIDPFFNINEPEELARANTVMKLT